MKKQAFNPYLPSWEYIPDAEPYVFGDRLYIYGSHDQFGGEFFCLNDYVCWSANVRDLASWRFEGTIYRKDQDPLNPKKDKKLFAPDVQKGLDGRYYLYYSLNGSSATSVAVCDTPAGSYEFYGHVKHADGRMFGSDPDEPLQFDPAIFIDDDDRIFLYTGFSPRKAMKEEFGIRHRTEGAYVVELEADMLTIRQGPSLLAPGADYASGTDFQEHAFFEASSLRKIKDRYYFIYSTVHGHELCYATSDQPDQGFEFGGTIVSNGDVFLDGRTLADALNYTGNTHGSLVKVQDQWYVFYHRQTNFHHYSRQNCAEKVFVADDGKIAQVPMTSCGLNEGPLSGVGTYPARIACNLRSAQGAIFYPRPRQDPKDHPYFTQAQPDHEGQLGGDGQYIANFRNGALAGFKHFCLDRTRQIDIKVRGNARGTMRVQTEIGGEPLAQIDVSESKDWQRFSASFQPASGEQALFFTFQGQGALDFLEFSLA